MRTPLEVLKVRHQRAVVLCHKVGYKSCAELRDAERLYGGGPLVAADVATLGMILRTNGLPRMKEVYLRSNGLGDAAMQALYEGLGRGAAPSLRFLSLAYNKFGPAGAEALAAALGRGAMPKIEILCLYHNPIGNRGVAALAAPLRKMPALNQLFLNNCKIGDEGVASLVDSLGKDDFKKCTRLDLDYNKITDAGAEPTRSQGGVDF